MKLSNETLCAEFAEIVGAQNVLGKKALSDLELGYHPDNLAADLAVLPASTAEVAKIVGICSRYGVGVVPQGGRTGLSGGAACKGGQVIVGLSRMRRIEKIDPLAAIAVVEAGAVLETVEEEVRQHRLSVGIDLAARGTATIGGMISTNAGGIEAFRNGSMRHRIVGLEVVLASGEVLDDMTEVTKSNQGYDLKQLVCGAEGTLGIVTRAALRLEPETPAPTTLLLGCKSASAALEIMRACQQAPELDLLHAEIMWCSAATRIADAMGLGSALSFCAADVYVIFDVVHRSGTGNLEDVLQDVLESGLLSGAVIDCLVAKNERERRDFWNIRENSGAIDANLPHCMWFDVSVPPRRLDDYVASVERKAATIDRSIGVHLIGHLADGNLHFTIGSGQALSEEVQDAITDAVYEDLAAMGGSFSAEHGIGTEKRAGLKKYASPTKLQLMKDIKRAFDPDGIMNPGKVL